MTVLRVCFAFAWRQVRVVPSAANIVRHARQHMVQRLNAYARNDLPLFQSILKLINDDFIHILQRQVCAAVCC